MVKPVPVLHLQRYAEAEALILEALERVLAARTGQSLHRSPFDLATLRVLHERMFDSKETDLASFVRFVAPRIRTLAMRVAERQSVIQTVRLKLVDLEQWLRRLDELDPDCVRIIELRYFAGLTIREAAVVLGTGVPEILGQLRFAKAWLQARVRWAPRSAP
jgi:DNA-directed RNA polymerase specialized sigma24 family protein